MPHPQPEGAPEQPGAAHSPGTHLAEQPTVHEFLTRLVVSSEARTAFEADPHASLAQAGLGDMTATDVLHATSLVLDYAPVEVVEEYGRSLQSSVENFAASTQQVAVNELHPAHLNDQKVMDKSMSEKAHTDFSKGGDVDPQMKAAPAKAQDVKINEQDSHNLVNVHDVASHNEVLSHDNVGIVGNTVNVASHDVVSAASSSVSSASASLGPVSQTVNHAVDTANNLVHDAGGGLPTPKDVLAHATSAPAHLPVVGAVAGSLPAPAHLPVVGAVAGNLPTDPAHLPAVGAVAGSLPAPAHLPVVGPVAEHVTDVPAHLPVAGPVVQQVTDTVHNAPVVGSVAEHVTDAPAHAPAVGAVAEHVTDAVHNAPVVGSVASELPVHDLPAVGNVTSALPLDHVL
jgi:hypothetical protein